MENLATIYAHNNPFVHLKQWQEEYSNYSGLASEYSKEGTRRLKTNIRDQWSTPTSLPNPKAQLLETTEIRTLRSITWKPIEHRLPFLYFDDGEDMSDIPFPKVSLEMIMDGVFNFVEDDEIGAGEEANRRAAVD
jgi:hypothetical protein